MIESIIILGSTAFILYLLARNVSLREQYTNKITGKDLNFFGLEITLSLLIFGFIAGARYNVGIDHLSYLTEYENLLNFGKFSRDSFEPGFVFISKVFAFLNAHYFFYFAFLGMLQIGFLYYGLKKHKYILPYVALYILLGPVFFNWMNGIRQVIVCCFLVFIVNFIIERKPIQYVVGVLIGTTIHSSAIILLPLYFLPHLDKIWKNRKLNLLLIFACIFIGANPIWIKGMQGLNGLMSILGNDRYEDALNNLIKGNDFRTISWGITMIVDLLLYLIIVWFKPKMQAYYKNDKYFNICFSLFILGVLLNYLLLNTVHQFQRPLMYFQVFTIPMVGFTINYFVKQKNTLLTFATGILSFSYLFFTTYKAEYAPFDFSECYLYRFFWENNLINY